MFSSKKKKNALVATKPPLPPRPQIKKKSLSVDETVLLPSSGQDEKLQDGRKRNREAIDRIRDRWIYQQMQSRRHEFTKDMEITVFAGTWNVNAKKAKEESLEAWLRADWKNQPDLVAIGLQEIVDLTAVNVAMGDAKTQRTSSYWTERIQSCLGSDYALTCSKSLVGLLICVFAKTCHREHVRYVCSSSVGAGALGVAGNKGGVSIRVRFCESTLCFVCTHLAAHRGNLKGRRTDFKTVYSQTSFDIGPTALAEAKQSGLALLQDCWGKAVEKSSAGQVSIADHDVCFWMGDLNYRIDEKQSKLKTKQVLKLAEKSFEQLIPHDQLNQQRSQGRVFWDFEEGPLTFLPTYKYQPGTNRYEQRADEKQRAPAWCDRILWRIAPRRDCMGEVLVKQLTYGRCDTPQCSDHKPVYSTFGVTIRDCLRPKRRAVHAKVLQRLGDLSDQEPVVALDRESLEFGKLCHGDSATVSLQLDNAGSSVAYYRLVPRTDEKTIGKRWMSRVSPTCGLLLPGEKVSIEFTVTVDKKTAKKMIDASRNDLQDTLKLRLENGRDYTLSVKGIYVRSSADPVSSGSSSSSDSSDGYSSDSSWSSSSSSD